MTDQIFRPSGFDFSNEIRNYHLQSKGVVPPKGTSTGTTIVGCIFDNGVILGADTRATSGDIVSDKNCEKIHYITDNIRCCGAGTAADTEFTTAFISSNMELHALQTGRKPRVVTAMTMLKQYLFRHNGHVGAALVLGGIDPTGPHLFTIHPHGSTDKLPYVTMGSGSLAAMAVFESSWKQKMDRNAAVELVKRAVLAGIFNDLGSGSNVDVCILTPEGTEMLRNCVKPNEREPREKEDYRFRRGTTAWKKESVRNLVVEEQVAVLNPAPNPAPNPGDAMDTT